MLRAAVQSPFSSSIILPAAKLSRKIAEIVKGVADGCVQAGCALVGGETAEHPGLMPDEEYDLAGFTVGIGEKNKLVSGENLKAGDALIGVASSGVHSNGFSLVRKVFDINEKQFFQHMMSLINLLAKNFSLPQEFMLSRFLL